MQHCGCSGLPSFGNAYFLSFDFAKDGVLDILHSRKHHKVHTSPFHLRRKEMGNWRRDDSKCY